MKPLYLCNFSCESDVYANFNVEPGPERIIFAWYGYGEYSGAAFVVFIKDDKMYEVNGSHCSCSGLEGQWEPEPTSPDDLRFRMGKGGLGHSEFYEGGEFADELRQCLDEYESEQVIQ